MTAAVEIIEPDALWMASGSCRSVDPELWFPDKTNTAHVQKAKAVCRGCPVREQCLQYALDNSEQYGVWGGKTRDERRPLRQGHVSREAQRRDERDALVRRLHADDRLTQAEIAGRLGITRQVVWAALHTRVEVS